MNSTVAGSSPSSFRSEGGAAAPSSAATATGGVSAARLTAGAGTVPSAGPVPAPALVPSAVVEWDRLTQIAADCSSRYRTARPFPHLVLDDVFSAALLDQAIAELPGVEARWTGYDTVNERKQVCSDTAAFGPTAETIAHALNSSRFVRFLEALTGIRGLIPDPHLHAAGYMKVPAGGFLGLHYDFATQRELYLDRRINVLLYLNRDWQSQWGGQLELHSNDSPDSQRHQEIKVEPAFNRLVIFNTPNALHGHRTPLTCPKGRSRLCLSWYYYTAPPVPGWAARSTSVEFKQGRFEPARAAVKFINLVTPPILLRWAKLGAQALRGK